MFIASGMFISHKSNNYDRVKVSQGRWSWQKTPLLGINTEATQLTMGKMVTSIVI
ncbi:hypothetical protein DWUX_2103 [Desulfovibrio diazotrophicus]|nr:hypothetical protein DWUX_2103 [Desulfovibrio diazotrophicus]